MSAYVSSANAGEFNTIELVDDNGNPLDNYSVLTGNSGSGMNNLSLGSVVSFLLTIPPQSTQIHLKTRTLKDGTPISNSSGSSIIVIDNTAGILSISPNYFKLNDYAQESQVITLNNIGNLPISDLNITIESPLSIVETSCTTSLAINARCNYMIKLNNGNPSSGSSAIIFSYYDSKLKASRSTTATVHYTSTNAQAGLIISSFNSNFDFISRTKSSVQTSLIRLTNTGNVALNGLSYVLPDKFTTNTIGISDNPCPSDIILQPNAYCNLNLVYNNDQVTVQTTEPVKVNYQYTNNLEILTGTSIIALTYQTLASTAILSLTPAPITFNNIVNNGVESNTQTIIIHNQGDASAGNLAIDLAGESASLFNISNNLCSNSLAPGASCNLNINFGPVDSSILAGTKTAKLNLNYLPYETAANIINSSNLTGFVASAQGANIVLSHVNDTGFIDGDGKTLATSYQIEQNSATPTVDYTISNTGSVDATDFYLSGSPSANWSISNSSCGTLNNKVTLAANGGICSVTYSLNTSSYSSYNLDLKNISMNWVDQDSPQGQTEGMNGLVYVNVYLPAKISFSSTALSIQQGSSANITATLTGGYKVTNQTLTINGVSGISAGSCTLNSTTNTCSISISVGTNTPYQAYSLSVNNSSSISVTSNLNLMVIQRTKYMFITSGLWNGNLGGFSGADSKCQVAGDSGSATPRGATWKALLDSNNATTVGDTYTATNGVMLGVSINSNEFVGRNNKMQTELSYDEYGSYQQSWVWTGGNGSDCNNWTSASNDVYGSQGANSYTFGSSGDSWFAAGTDRCNRDFFGTLARLYCVQQ